ncbi:hypothetical protein [Ignicoccus hospitalis]|uniref:hypothetical protein n=1 Tax=Ignicoccus hospitalis TaxID=160233 RepID=UPI0006969A5F|nr:hypothetical protein [Ignicoccus hospitalis]HIH90272.1 hypothetical protein [Desulfurococcaceae archaeon]
MADWGELLLLNYAFLYSLSTVFWRTLRDKVKKERPFALAYATGAHLIFLTSLLRLNLIDWIPLVITSYLIMSIISITRPDKAMLPYVYTAWATLLALEVAMG